MKQLTALLWKEWFEVRVFLGIGLFVFLGLPFIGALENGWSRHLELAASLWVYFLGGLLAVIIAVGIVVRDLNGKLEEFWRSRPLGVVRWLLVKYVVGLAVVFAALGVPLIVELAVNRTKVPDPSIDPSLILHLHPVLWAALYSVSFAIASLLRRGAHAAMLSIAAMLLLYFLPSILPPIRFLSLSRAMDPDVPGSRAGFIVGMIALCTIGLLISLAAVRRDWRIESDRKLIYWSIGGALLILFSSAAFQVASNLPMLGKATLPGGQGVLSILSDGSNGILLSGTERMIVNGGWAPSYFVQKLRVGPSSVEVGSAMEVKVNDLAWYTAVWQPQHPEVIYTVVSGPDYVDDSTPYYPILQTINLSGAAAKVDLQAFPDVAVPHWPFGRVLYASHDRLYLLGPKLMIFDISEPATPRLLSIEPFAWTPGENELSRQRDQFSNTGDPEIVTVLLPPIPGLSVQERLKQMNRWRGFQVDGDILIAAYADHLTSYRLDKLTDRSAIFRKLGRYDPSSVEKLFSSNSTRDVKAMGGLFFKEGYNDVGGGSTVTVFDTTGPRLRPVGHFAFASEYSRALCPLPDGRLLAAIESNAYTAARENHLYLLGPPPKH